MLTSRDMRQQPILLESSEQSGAFMSIRDRTFIVHNPSMRHSQHPVAEVSENFDREVPSHVLEAQRRHSKTRPGTLHYSSRPTITAEFTQRPQEASSDYLRLKQERAAAKKQRAGTSKGPGQSRFANSNGRYANSISSLNQDNESTVMQTVTSHASPKKFGTTTQR